MKEKTNNYVNEIFVIGSPKNDSFIGTILNLILGRRTHPYDHKKFTSPKNRHHSSMHVSMLVIKFDA
jgi:hypothetical protein